MHARLMPIARKLAISDLLKKYSGGQKQYAAVARAIITNSKLILADEPTGALDSKSSHELLRLFGEINKCVQSVLIVILSRPTVLRSAWRL